MVLVVVVVGVVVDEQPGCLFRLLVNAVVERSTDCSTVH